MAIQYDNNSKRFQVSYQSPFGGIDSSAFASAINPKNFASITQGINDANYLSAVHWQEVINTELSAGAGFFLGYIPIAESSTIGYIITTNAVVVLTADGMGGIVYTTITPYAPVTATYGYFSYQVIDDLLIWTTQTWNEIWSFNTITQAITLLTNYVGGGILGVLDNQLINLGGVSNRDGEVPYRISWSAPGEYGSFQPYDVSTNTGNYSAGFNDLPSTSDILQGIITTGTVAYIIRSQGITQMNITGNGTVPFQFNHLWASELGIGTVFPDTVAQYGSMGAFVSDSGIYSIGLNGISDVTGDAKDVLYNLINNIANFAVNAILPEGVISARCVPYLGTHPSVYYVIAIANSMTFAPTGSQASINSYALFALDFYNGSSCYSLGTLPVAQSATQPSANAVGKVSYINRNYLSAPAPTPPAPITYPGWVPDTYYTVSNTLIISSTAGTIYAFPPFSTAGLYLINSAGNIPTDNPWAVNLPLPAAIGTVFNYGTASFTYLGLAQWQPGQNYQLNQGTTLDLQVIIDRPPPFSGPEPFPQYYAYKCISPGISGANQNGFTTNPGDVIIDGSAVWQCLGRTSYIIPEGILGGGANSYNVAPVGTIADPTSYLQQNTTNGVTACYEVYTVGVATLYYNYWYSGGFSQNSAPTWSHVVGGTTTEPKITTDQLLTATWLCLGAKPSPATSLVGANSALLVPLFVAINNNTAVSGLSTLTGQKLLPPTATDSSTFVFRMEQMKFGSFPTVTKVGFLAALIDPNHAGVISVSVDGGATFNNAFANIIIQSGPAYLAIGTYYADGVQTLERPQLAFSVTNVQVVEAWYQGTLAEYELI